jgi:hypothetical protein
MQQPFADRTTIEQALARVARDGGFSEEAVATLWKSMVHGRGAMAQFNHPELGGDGQWMRFGMAMVGDRFNLTLASRVGALGDRLALLHGDLYESVR